MLQDHQEFITAEAADEIAGSQRAFERAAHLTQKLVAADMAKTVVDLFEVIEVNHYDCKRAAIDRGIFQCALQAPFKLTPVEKSRQRVVTCLMRPLPRLPM